MIIEIRTQGHAYLCVNMHYNNYTSGVMYKTNTAGIIMHVILCLLLAHCLG